MDSLATDKGGTSAPSVKKAMDRLDAALGQLEAAVNRRVDFDRKYATVDEELQRLGEDRSRLAQDLDASETKAARLEDTNREVSRRLVAAMETIRAVLEDHGG